MSPCQFFVPQLGADTLEKASSYSVVLPTLRELKIDLKYVPANLVDKKFVPNHFHAV